ISDYLFIKSKLFASVNLPDDEFKLYSTLFDIIQPNLPKPDLLIYLHAPMQKLRENIKQRNRSYEQNIPDEYLQNLQNAYLQLIRSDQYRTLIIDTSQTDFLNNKQQFERLIDYLDQDYEAGFHFLNFSDV
ncbi:MAG TPA: deoxynucleoside kinase, partial [Chitinophagaceae bacterium]|nr:deoxynucleoside kinase [Chitinophagaceae bacterium]